MAKEKLIEVKKEKKPDARIAVNNQIVNISRRIQIIESKTDNIIEKNQIFEKNFLNVSQNMKKDTIKINSDINDIKENIKKINNTLKLVIEELKLRAKVSDFKVLEKYIEFFSPLKYVTMDEVQSLINDAILKQSTHVNSNKVNHAKNINGNIDKKNNDTHKLKVDSTKNSKVNKLKKIDLDNIVE